MLKHKIQYAFAFAVILFFCSAFVFKNDILETKTKRTLAELVAMFPKAENQIYEFSKDSLFQESDWLAQTNYYKKLLEKSDKQFLPFVSKRTAFSRFPLLFVAEKLIETDKYYVFIYRRSRMDKMSGYDQIFISVLDKVGTGIHHEYLNEGLTSGEEAAFKITPDLMLEKAIYDVIWTPYIRGQQRTHTIAYKRIETIDLKTNKPFLDKKN